MKYLLNISIALLLATSVCGQKYLFGQNNLYINLGVDTLDADVKKALQLYRQYLNEFKDKKTPDFNKYWSKQDCEKYKCPDQIAYTLTGFGHALYGSVSYNKNIIYVKPVKDYINIKTLYEGYDGTNYYPFCITNHYIKFDEQQHPYFVNINEWQTKKVRNITYYFPPQHTFNQKRADSLISRMEQFEKDWNVKPIKFRYYFADTWEEMEKLKGFDMTYDMGNRDKPTGRTTLDTVIYCAGMGENYFHEVMRILMFDDVFSKTCLGDGLTVFYGGGMGHDLSWHIPRLKEYLNKHPEIDLNQLRKFYYMDNYTNPNQTIQGLLCLIIYKKDGLAGLKRLMQYETMQDVFEKEFNVKEGEWNTFFKKAD